MKLWKGGVKVTDRLTPHTRSHFFKYVTCEGAINILSNIAIKWSSPLTFNDPFDILVKPNIGFTEEEFKKYSEQRILDEINSKNTPTHNEELITKIRAASSHLAEGDLKSMLKLRTDTLTKQVFSIFTDYQNQWLEFAKNIRVLCLSEVHDNLLMWAHYAKDHTGAVIKLKCLPDSETSPSSRAIRVEYQDSFPSVATVQEWTDEILNIRNLNRNEIFLKFMATKSTHWAYEKEWRCLDQKRPTDNGDHEICAIHPEEIEAVYLGCRMSEDNKKSITDYACGKLNHVKVYEIQQHPERYQLVFREVEKDR